ncbi:MAG: ABC transporter ATP-binding protein [Clostridia bacterium]|nr:ABC transporter ATP-binding protein [Clostridia bacterium]
MEKAEEKGIRRSRGAIRFIAGRLRGQLPVLGLLSFMMAAVSALSVSMAVFMARAINAAFAGDMRAMTMNLVIMAAVTVAGLSLRFASKLIQTRMAFRMEMALRRDLLDTVLTRDQAGISAYHSGDVMNRLTNDVSVVAAGASGILPKVFELVSRLVCAFVILASIDWVFALLCLGAAAVIAVFSLVLRPVLKKLHRRVQETEGDTRAFMQETVENGLVVRVFGAKDIMLKRGDVLQERGFRAAMKRRLVTVLSGEGLSLVFTLGVLGALTWGTLSIAGVFGPERAIDYGSLAAVLQLVSQVQTPFAALSGLVPQYFAMLASAERLMELHAIDGERTCGETPSRFISAELRGVNFSYYKDGAAVPVLEDASLKISRGEYVAIAGISGIGKSTLMKLLLGVYSPGGGSIELVTDRGALPASAATRGLFAYVPQGNLLLSGTLRENIAFFSPGADDAAILRAADTACASEFIEKLPYRLDTRIGEHGMGLSEGQAQRIAVCRAVLRGADVLLLDEATSALDADTEARLLENLRASGVETVIIITHREAALRVCDRVLRIENGRVTEDGARPAVQK